MLPRRAVAGLALLLGTSACSARLDQACTLMGGSSALSIAVAPTLRASLTSLRLELCQGDRCGRTSIPATPQDPGETSSFVALDGLGDGWDPDATSRLEVRGVAVDGTVVVRRTERFEFDHFYPNGRECDVTPYLTHHTRLTDRDRVG
ncbi:hypothetical protein GCM10027596_17420 [Nocardioides korecus]